MIFIPDPKQENIGSDRRYTVSPAIAFGMNGICMGVIDDYKRSLSYPNFAVSGPRDAESICKLDKIYWYLGRAWREVLQKKNGHALLEALVLGDNLLALTLLIGSRLAADAEKTSDATAFWKDDVLLKPYADLLLKTYATLYAKRRRIPVEQAQSILEGRADWMRLARQCAFFMTKAYQEYVETGADPKHFPPEIYGPNVSLEGMGPYHDEEREQPIPYWPENDLGAANAAMPITEFERAWVAFLFGENLEELLETA